MHVRSRLVIVVSKTESHRRIFGSVVMSQPHFSLFVRRRICRGTGCWLSRLARRLGFGFVYFPTSVVAGCLKLRRGYPKDPHGASHSSTRTCTHLGEPRDLRGSDRESMAAHRYGETFDSCLIMAPRPSVEGLIFYLVGPALGPGLFDS